MTAGPTKGKKRMCVISDSGTRICPSKRATGIGGVHLTVTDPDGPSDGGQTVISLSDDALHELLRQVRDIEADHHRPEWSHHTPR